MKWLASIGLSGTVLALFAAVTSIAIGWTYLSTEEQIEVAIRRAEAQQLLEIFPALEPTIMSLSMTPFPSPAIRHCLACARAPGLSCETQGPHCGGHHPNDCAGWLQWRY